jgi:hypothetical protein
MMKITATAATPYRAVELTPVVVVVVTVPPPDPDMVTVVAVPVMVVVTTCPLARVVVVVTVCPGMVVVVTEVVTEVVVLVLVVVTVVVLVLAVVVGTFCRLKATMSPAVVPGQVDTASKLQVPTGTRMYSCPLTAAPIVTPWSIGAPT